MGMLDKNKQRFIELCHTYIHREGINELLEWLEQTDFFIAPASSKYHFNFEGGLCYHSLNVFDNLVHLFTMIKDNNITYYNYNDFAMENIAIVALFHDFCKINFYDLKFRNVKNDFGEWERVSYYVINSNNDELSGHGIKSARIVSKFMHLTDMEFMAITYHMGFSADEARINPAIISEVFNKNTLATLLNSADMISTFIQERSVASVI